MGEGNIRVMIPDLLFKGLRNLMEEDRDDCFLYPDNFTNQARKRTDMATKFQCIREKWCEFEEPLAKMRCELKKGKSKLFKLATWLGSTVESKELLGNCVMDLDNMRANGGKVNILFKQMQVLRTVKNIILVGVPTNVDTKSLTDILYTAMEAARVKMVAKNTEQFSVRIF